MTNQSDKTNLSLKNYDFSYKFSLEEYESKLAEFHKTGLLEYPSLDDHKDVLYTKKYAHTMPPLAAYKVRPPNFNLSSTAQNT